MERRPFTVRQRRPAINPRPKADTNPNSGNVGAMTARDGIAGPPQGIASCPKSFFAENQPHCLSEVL
jgi:hypothetical protein